MTPIQWAVAVFMILVSLGITAYVVKAYTHFAKAGYNFVMKPVRLITGRKSKNDMTFKHARLLTKIEKKEREVLFTLLYNQNKNNPALAEVAKLKKLEVEMIEAKKANKAAKKEAKKA